jgi:tetratricopeptide (TPR) repeat protein
LTAAWPLLALLLAPTAAAEAPAARDEYLDLIARARDGDVRGALARLLEWTPEETAAARPECIGDCLRASLLLHTEAQFIQRFLGHKEQGKAHIGAAENARRRIPKGDFDRRWLLAMGYRHQEWAMLGRARGLFEEALRDYPNDAEALLALGSLHEQLASLPAPDNRTVYRHGELMDARRWYEKALAEDPGYAEARLRVGRVDQMLGQIEQARRELGSLVAAEPPPAVAGYAHLFLGRMAEQGSQPEVAIDHYRHAVAANRSLQAAYLSLSLALHAAGRAQEAAEVTLEGLRGTQTADIDGWYGYHCRDLHGYRLTMDRLWAELRP